MDPLLSTAGALLLAALTVIVAGQFHDRHDGPESHGAFALRAAFVAAAVAVVLLVLLRDGLLVRDAMAPAPTIQRPPEQAKP